MTATFGYTIGYFPYLLYYIWVWSNTIYLKKSRHIQVVYINPNSKPRFLFEINPNSRILEYTIPKCTYHDSNIGGASFCCIYIYYIICTGCSVWTGVDCIGPSIISGNFSLPKTYSIYLSSSYNIKSTPLSIWDTLYLVNLQQVFLPLT